jgi:RimJ/RimL family protein N-acetyltransferase
MAGSPALLRGHNGPMTNPVWPLFGLTVTTPRLQLRYVDDALATQLALLAAGGIHDPSFMPFGIAWSDVESPLLERNTVQYYWRCRAETSATHFDLSLAVLADDEVVGVTGLTANDFPIMRQFETGSWLGRAFHGRGLGKELRRATLHLGFVGLGATMATTSAFADNGASLGVTRSLGYAENGHGRHLRRGQIGDMLRFDMTVEHWQQHVRRDDITIDGIEACLPLLGL